MKCRAFLIMVVMVALVVLSSATVGQEINSGTQASSGAAQLQQNMPNGAEFAQLAPVTLKIPFNLVNNSTKTIWTSPGELPTYIVAGIVNNGKLKMDVMTVSLTPDTKERKWKSAGEALPGGDGLVVFGKFVEIWIKCQNATTKQYSTGTLEVATWIPQ